MRRNWTNIVMAVSLVGSVMSARADLVNGGMEGGTSLSDLPGWTTWGPSGVLEGGYFQSGSQSIRLWWDDTGLFQSFAVTPGQSYTVDGYLFTPTSDRYTWDVGNNTYTALKLEWYQADGSTSAGPSIESTHFTPADAADVWTYRSVAGAAPGSAAFGRVVLAIAGSAPGSGTVAFDTLSVTSAVPEPSTMGLLALSLLGVPLWWRRRKK